MYLLNATSQEGYGDVYIKHTKKLIPRIFTSSPTDVLFAFGEVDTRVLANIRRIFSKNISHTLFAAPKKENFLLEGIKLKKSSENNIAATA